MSWHFEERIRHRLFPIFMAFSLKIFQSQLQWTLSSEHHIGWLKLFWKSHSFSGFKKGMKFRETLGLGKWKRSLRKEKTQMRSPEFYAETLSNLWWLLTHTFPEQAQSCLTRHKRTQWDLCCYPQDSLQFESSQANYQQKWISTLSIHIQHSTVPPRYYTHDVQDTIKYIYMCVNRKMSPNHERKDN